MSEETWDLNGLPEEPATNKNKNECCEASSPGVPETKSNYSFDYTQWSMEPNGIFRPSGPRCGTVPPGMYEVDYDDRGLFFRSKKIITDDLIELDDNVSNIAIKSIRKFWKSKENYEKRKIVYKRGVFLYGPPGSGKTATLMLLIKELLAQGGIVVCVTGNPSNCNTGLQVLRAIEPNRPLIVIMEDVDEIISSWGEHGILSLLDGENQIGNVVNIATSNYPDRLGGRIVNRPSRFDERIFVGMPNEKAREKYLRHATKNENISEEELSKWVRDTDKFSVAHLKELVVAVFCLQQEYDSVIARLKAMFTKPKTSQEFGNGDGAGFGLSGKPKTNNGLPTTKN